LSRRIPKIYKNLSHPLQEGRYRSYFDSRSAASGLQPSSSRRAIKCSFARTPRSMSISCIPLKRYYYAVKNTRRAFSRCDCSARICIQTDKALRGRRAGWKMINPDSFIASCRVRYHLHGTLNHRRLNLGYCGVQRLDLWRLLT